MTFEDVALRLLYLALAQFAYRCLPIILLSVFQPKARSDQRWGLLGATGLIVAMCESVGVPALRALARGSGYLAYFCVASIALYLVPRRRVLHALGCMLLFLLLPGVIGRHIDTLWAQESVVLGWEAMFAAYSALTITPRVSLSSYLQFVLVDPIYLYRDRSVRSCTSPAAGLNRVALGVCAVAANFGLVAWVNQGGLPSGRLSARGADVLQLDVYALALALSHVGLSWMQIGAMAVAGYSTPPRFRNPWWSSSFQNFWQRWNVWLGRWAQVHLFVPLALTLKRRGGAYRSAATPLADVGTFAVIGVLHDVAGWCGRGLSDFRLGFSLLFVLFGVFLCAERWLTGLLPQPGRARRYLGRAAFLLVGAPGLIWLAMPALKGNFIHPIFRLILGLA